MRRSRAYVRKKATYSVGPAAYVSLPSARAETNLFTLRELPKKFRNNDRPIRLVTRDRFYDCANGC